MSSGWISEKERDSLREDSQYSMWVQRPYNHVYQWSISRALGNQRHAFFFFPGTFQPRSSIISYVRWKYHQAQEPVAAVTLSVS